MRRQIVQQGIVRNRYAMRETGRAAGILQIANFVGLRRRKLGLYSNTVAEAFPINAFDIAGACRIIGHVGEFRWKEQYLGIAALQLHGQLVYIAFFTAK